MADDLAPPAPRPGAVEALLGEYRPTPGIPDELMRPDGTMRAAWAPLISHLAAQDPETRAASFARGDQYLHDTGVYFLQSDAKGGPMPRDWPLSHVPVIISGAEWADLAGGIAQRAELLERVMADLYGPATLVRGGMLPPELLTRNPEWLRPVVGTRPRSGHFLHLLAFEIGRSPDGSWFVLGDRTQAPSGAGFALENRMASGRIFPELFPRANVERLAGFFRGFRDALNGMRASEEGRVAILSPGQHTDTYYEHAYIARYLGFMLLETGDLKVENGALTVRTTRGPVPIDVLWRRLDARFADPLELDEGSALGTPGMVSALRAGAMTMVNCLGSGVLESRALMAFLPRIAREVLGEPLKLPNIATWWCGQDRERDYVAANLDRMMIGPALSTRLPFDISGTTALGGRFRAGAEQSVADWLAREGGALCGQEAVTLSTTPAMIDGQLVPRPMVVRVFAARTPQGWTVMPGGYARIGQTDDPTALAMQSGGSVADVWVVGDAPVSLDTLTAPQRDGAFSRRHPGLLPARAGDNLFWLGRYTERAETAVRILRAYHLRIAAYGETPLPLLEALEAHMAGLDLDPEAPLPEPLLAMFDHAVGCAAGVRDRFSTDGWNALNDLARTARDLATRVKPGDDAARAMSVLLRKLAGFSGLVHENMFRFDGWRFLTIGRALERAIQMAAMLERFADFDSPSGGYDVAVELGDSVMTHRRRYSVETYQNTVMDLLALDGDNPRSLVFQLAVLTEQEEKLSGTGRASQRGEAARALLSLRTELEIAAPDALTADRLAAIRGQLLQVSTMISTQYLG
ncbi:circularly permuted type 2 ATP-grasp protein [Mesobacterium pallidum]|uniref:circularly permuted type 2 ATP-grasp protein n=1 Tax=Mesobacterium pallidum TaxID=2872037 RepID=UPI001EE20586|nr:circularly permuted type 2 ATP-grasp protein [Mesobacterium pallidum]